MSGDDPGRPGGRRLSAPALPVVGELTLSLEESPQPARREKILHTLRTIAGLRVERQVWGLTPWDLGVFGRKRVRRDTSEMALIGAQLPPSEIGRISIQRESRSRTWSRSIVERAHVHSSEPMSFHRVPFTLHEWGEEQHDVHPSWGDLFLDLIFVSAAYQMSSLLGSAFYHCCPIGTGEHTCASTDGSGSASGSDGAGAGSESGSASTSISGGARRQLAGSTSDERPCVGLAVGVFYAVALFQGLQRVWLTETSYYRSNFSACDKVHYLLDMAVYFCLIVASSNIGQVQYFMHPTSHGDIRVFGFLLPLFVAACIWALRFLEVALFASSEAARRWSASRLVDDLGLLLLFWLPPLVLDFYVEDEAGKKLIVLPILVGAYWPELRLFWRWVLVPRCIPGNHLPTTRTRPPASVAFLIHRFDEFMYLMLGETVLGMVIAPRFDGAHADHHYITMAGGFVIVTCMLFSYQIIEPRDASEHAFRRSAVAGVLYMLSYCEGAGIRPRDPTLGSDSGIPIDAPRAAPASPSLRTLLRMPMCPGRRRLLGPSGVSVQDSLRALRGYWDKARPLHARRAHRRALRRRSTAAARPVARRVLWAGARHEAAPRWCEAVLLPRDAAEAEQDAHGCHRHPCAAEWGDGRCRCD